MSLTSEERNALDSTSFAVPDKRELPIHDAEHVRLAWDMVDRTKGLTQSERATARERILHKAKELGVDTSTWKTEPVAYAIPDLQKLPLYDREHILMAASAINSVKGVTDEQRIEGRINIAVAADRYGLNVRTAQRARITLESMAIDMPDVPGHPNRMPFSGVMTRLDTPSNHPVGGTTSKKVVIPTHVAEKAIPSLLGMAVDYTPDFDGHDRQSKIGVITEAYIGAPDPFLGAPLHIAGFFYAADFPQEMITIQAQKDLLGFSYEAEAFVENMLSDPWVCSSCDFTGAAVLYKDKAAFTATSLQATIHKGATMTPEEIAALQAKATELEAALQAKTAELEAAKAAAIEASSVHNLVKPHTDKMREAADSLEAAGIGADPKNGHAAVMRKMADHIESQAMLGNIPSTFDSYYYGSSQEAAKESTELTASKQDEIAALQTKLIDMEAKFATLSAASLMSKDTSGDRKSLPPSTLATIKRIGLEAADASTLTVAAIDEACQKAGLTTSDSIALKLNLRAAGALV